MAVHEERIECLGIDHHPTPCCAIAFTSLESFHSRGSDRPTERARLTQREALHFIIAMATGSWV
jgi:hypothetical protein